MKNFEEKFKEYTNVVNNITSIFLEKQCDDEDECSTETEMGRWINDNVGEIYEYGDYYLDFRDILLDLKLNAPQGEIFKWYDYDLECRNLGLSTMNYYSWLHNAPKHTDFEMERIRELHQNVLKAKNELEEALATYNEDMPF